MTSQMDGMVLEREYGSEYLLQQHSRQPCLLSTLGQVLLLPPDFATMSGSFSFYHPSLRSAILFHLGLALWDCPISIQDDASQSGVALLVEPVLQLLLAHVEDSPAIDARLIFVLLLSFLKCDHGGTDGARDVHRPAQCLRRLP